jgi:hypothetical protein
LIVWQNWPYHGGCSAPEGIATTIFTTTHNAPSGLAICHPYFKNPTYTTRKNGKMNHSQQLNFLFGNTGGSEQQQEQQHDIKVG